MISISRTSHTFQASGKKLKRARHLFVVMNKKALCSPGREEALRQMAETAYRRRLWIVPYPNMLMFPILRELSRIEGTPPRETLKIMRTKKGILWWDWLEQTGWKNFLLEHHNRRR